MKNISWDRLQLVIFDVDGTLYNQSKLRKIMFIKLFSYYIIRIWKYRDLLILYHFRKEREKMAGYKGKDLEEEQYTWCAKKTNEKVSRIKRVIDKWIFNAPNDYLERCMYPDVNVFLSELKNNGIKTAVYSDYNASVKLAKMKVHVDFELSSTDKRVSALKPLPDGILVILNEMEVTDKKDCLFVGDRFELDGICAENAGVPFLLIDKLTAAKDFYLKLSTMLFNVKNKVVIDVG